MAGIGDPLVVVDARLALLYRNRAAEQLVGNGPPPADPALWVSTFGLHHPDERTPFAAEDLPLVRALETGRDVRDVPMFLRNETVPEGVHVVASASPFRDEHGAVRGVASVFRDVTDQRRAEAKMQRVHEDLERRVVERTAELAEAHDNLLRKERLAVLGQLAGGVAHQIRNPLAAIMNATYVLKRHLSSERHPNVEDAIRIIHDEVRHANVIITGLLDYARVRTPDRHPASIVDLLERILASTAIPSNVLVRRALPVQDEVVREIDSDQLHRAISNVVRNAVEAMPDGGELTMELDAKASDVVISISDTGIGISSQLRSHLFEPLHSTKPMGIGLGLVTARRFVEAHGGRIAYVDVPVGARFEIRLPASS